MESVIIDRQNEIASSQSKNHKRSLNEFASGSSQETNKSPSGKPSFPKLASKFPVNGPKPLSFFKGREAGILNKEEDKKEFLEISSNIVEETELDVDTIDFL